MPRIAGMLKWSQELRDRVNSSLDKLKNLDKGYYYQYHVVGNFCMKNFVSFAGAVKENEELQNFKWAKKL